MDEQENQLKQADFMMENILKFGKYSFELEEKREDSLIKQSGQMLTAFSIFSAVLIAALNIVIGLKIVSTGKLLFCASIVYSVLLASLVLALLVQWRYKYQTMEDVQVFYESINKAFTDYQRQAGFDMQWMEQIGAIHKSKLKNNDTRSRLIQASMIMFLIAIGFVIAFAIYLTVLYL